MGSFVVDSDYALSITSSVNAQMPQAFKIWRRRVDLPEEYLGFYGGGTSLVYPALPVKAVYVIEGYYNEGSQANPDWEESDQAKHDLGDVVVFRHDDGGGDNDWDDLIVNCRRVVPKGNRPRMFTGVHGPKSIAAAPSP